MDSGWFIGPAFVLGVWGIATLILIGVGVGAGRILRLRTTSMLDAFWLGYCLTVVVLQVWHLWLPVNGAAVVTLAITGAVGFASAVASGELRTSLSSIRKRPTSLLLLCLVTVWVANRATAPVDNVDSAYYHLSGVRWNTDFPIVPGLGNLNGRLAYNNSSLLFVGLFEVGPLRGRSSHFANSLLLAALFWQVIIRSKGLLHLDRRPRDRAAAAYNVLMLVPAIAIAVGRDLAAPATDVPLIVSLLYATGRLFDILLWREAPIEEEPESMGTGPFAVLTATIAFTTAVCLKLAAIVFAPFAWIVLICAWWLAKHRFPAPVVRRVLVTATGISILLIGTWMLRGILLSGYPAFPRQELGVNVDWRMPPELVEHEAYIIDTWARYGRAEFVQRSLARVPWLNTFALESPPAVPFNPPASYPDGSDASDPPVSKRRDPWVVLWLIAAVLSTPTEFLVPISMACVAWIAALRRRGPAGRSLGAPSVIGALVVVGVVLWFLTAPEPRWGMFLFWPLASSGVAALMLTITNRDSGVRLGRAIVLLVALMSLIPIAYRMVRVRVQSGIAPFSVLPFYYPGPDHGLHPLPTAHFSEYRSYWGTTFYFPQGNPYMWDGPLPSSPQLSRFLRLRREGDLGSGFRIDVPPGHRARVR